MIRRHSAVDCAPTLSVYWIGLSISIPLSAASEIFNLHTQTLYVESLQPAFQYFSPGQQDESHLKDAILSRGSIKLRRQMVQNLLQGQESIAIGIKLVERQVNPMGP